MITLSHLLPELIARIAAESYRTWQLVRLTCKKHYFGLGDCKYEITSATAATRGPSALLSHSELIDRIIWSSHDEIDVDPEPVTVYILRARVEPQPIIGWNQERMDDLEYDSDEWPVNFTFYIGGGICELVEYGHCGCDIEIEDVGFQIRGEYSARKVAKFIYDNLPELYYRYMVPSGNGLRSEDRIYHHSGHRADDDADRDFAPVELVDQ